MAFVLLDEGGCAWDQGDLARAMQLLEAALALYQELGDHFHIATTLHRMGDVARERGDAARAMALLEQSLAMCREGGYVDETALVLTGLGDVACTQGDLARATALYWEALMLLQSKRIHLASMWPLCNLGWLALLQGDDGRVLALLQQHIDWFQEKAELAGLTLLIPVLGAVINAQGGSDQATVILRDGLILQQRVGWQNPMIAGLEAVAGVALGAGQPVRAARLLAAAEALRATLGAPRIAAVRLAYERELAAAHVQLDDVAFAAAWAAGQLLTLEDAMAEALVALDQVKATAAVPGIMTAVLIDDLAHEVALAAEIQLGLLPASLPQPAGWRIAAALLPARETAGDFYDCFLLPDGRLALVIADVAGKGLGAALYMATGRALIRTLVPLGITAPAAVLAGVNARLLEDTHAGLFITAFFGLLDPTSGTLTYANAGYPPPLLLADSTGRVVQLLSPTGLVLGVEPGASWCEETVVLSMGDRLLLYTDGVTEAQDVGGAFFETEQLLATLAAGPGDDVETVVARVRAAVLAFAGALPQFDDITLLAVQHVHA